MTPLAITGIGIATAAGVGKEAFFAAISDARDGRVVAPLPKDQIQSFDAKSYDGVNVVEVPSFDPTKVLGDKGLRTLDRVTKLLVVAARLCLQDARIKNEGQYVASNANGVGLVCSNAYGSLEAITELDRVALLEDARYINPAKFPNTVSNSAAGYVSIWEDVRALNVSVSNGNTGALDAIGIAEMHLVNARADVLVTGGGESMCEALFLAFKKLGALRAQSDGGFVLGEGAAFLSLELDAHAKARGANVLGHVAGYGTHFTPPEDDAGLLHPSTDALERAIANALADAKLDRNEIDLVVTGVSGIRPFDRAELDAIDKAIGKEKKRLDPKRVFGETLGASGAVAVGAAVNAIANGTAKHALVTSLGYYGNASAVVVSR
jgi:3-oxoacyl-(acyl-carrier-protein) synthase